LDNRIIILEELIRLSEPAIPIWFVTASTWDATRVEIGEAAAKFAEACGFKPKAGRMQLLPDGSGALAGVLFGDSENDDDVFGRLGAGKLGSALPAGDYRFANSPRDPELSALGFQLGLYRYTRFKADESAQPRLTLASEIDAKQIESLAAAVAFGRDLVNTPANVLTPSALEAAAKGLAQTFGAEVETIVGDELLARNFPLIHAVGAAADEAPRLVDMVWGRQDAPKVTLVGKGVVFDTGGLDIKPANGMDLMKKDMGGAATALALARMVIEAELDVRLRVILPIVENAIAAKAMRPSDVIMSRKGLSVEIGNTDAEGRLILADALTYACEEKPELLFDFATLTGAARVALGPDLPPFYTDDDALATSIASHGMAVADPVWRLPLWRPYDSYLESKVADLNNAPGSPFAGSVTAALFLRRFVAGVKRWAHFDVYAWNPKPRAHGAVGGEIQAARALFALLKQNYPRR
jgi:leucyl aminopeptidase